MDASQNHRLLNAVISNRFKQKPATMNILFNHCGPNFETSPCRFSTWSYPDTTQLIPLLSIPNGRMNPALSWIMPLIIDLRRNRAVEGGFWCEQPIPPSMKDKKEL